MKISELIDGFFYETKKNIVALVKTDLSNENKKLMLDHTITEWLEKTLNGVPLNFFFKLIIKQLILPHVSLITQWIFDLLKAKVEGITKVEN